MHVLKIANKYGRGFALKNRILSSQRILEKNFPINQNFSFIQIGANDGKSFDFLFDFVTSRQSTGIVVEPVKGYYNELVLNYKAFPGIIKINKAVHSHEKLISIHKIRESKRYKYPEWIKGIASFDRNHHKKTNILTEDMEVETVCADTLMNLLSFYPSKKIHYLQIDTEGYDLEILKMVDFKILRPLLIKFEHVNLKRADRVISRKLLSDEGYSVFKEGSDTLGLDLHRIKLI